MSVVVNTNLQSIKAQNLLNSATNSLNTAMNRLSSGLKINSAKDDAAGSTISSKMGVQLSANTVAQNNAQAANALLQTTEGSYDTVFDNIQRIRDLTLQAKNGTYSEKEIQAMQDEVTARMDEIDRISDSSKYSDLQLFGDTTSTNALATKGAVFQIGTNKGDENEIAISNTVFGSIHFSVLTGATDFDLKAMTADPAKFDEAIAQLDTAVDKISANKSLIGATQNRIDSALSNLSIQKENLSSADSLIKDADMAEEASSYTKQNILQQITTSLLSTANSSPSIALSLL